MVKSLDKLSECFGKGLLKKTIKQADLARKDLHQAEFFLTEGEELLQQGRTIMASLALYNAYFHCARALLFNDGIKERSHYCIARYLEEEYVLSNRTEAVFLDAFETIMSIRHNAQYSTEEIKIEEDLNELHNICERFIASVGKLIM